MFSRETRKARPERLFSPSDKSYSAGFGNTYKEQEQTTVFLKEMLGPSHTAGTGGGVSPAPSSASARAPIRKSRLRRQPKRPVPTHILPFAKNSWVVSFSAIGCVLCCSVIPIWILQGLTDPEHHPRAVHGVHQLMSIAQQIRSTVVQTGKDLKSYKELAQMELRAKILTGQATMSPPVDQKQLSEKKNSGTREVKTKVSNQKHGDKTTTKKELTPSLAEQQVKPHFTLSDLMHNSDDKDNWASKPVARGLAGRPLSETPAVLGAQRAHIKGCEINVDSLAYWNDPVGTRDMNFISPFAKRRSDDEHEQFITFTSDHGGWNNVRMSMEILFVLAAVTGRTLVLPPKEPLYLLNRDHGAKHRGFADFFPFDNPNFPVKLISMEEFLTKNPRQQQQLHESKWIESKDRLLKASKSCDHLALSSSSCITLNHYLKDVGHNPGFSGSNTCLLFDVEASKGRSPSSEAEALAKTFCGERTVVYWNEEDHGRYNHIHIPAGTKEFRLLTHFYNIMYFSDAAVGNYMKRFVRDFLHYNDAIYCAAGKIVKAIQAEGMQRGFALDAEKGGAYSAMHIRRGDLQYKKVKISAQEWYDNTKEVWQDRELLYIATDERNKTFFDDLARHYELRFLDDYWDLASLSQLDPNYMGMIDTIVASRGRAFAGTWFSTFSGYITRLRGYHGLSMKDTWYSFLPKKTAVHVWPNVTHYAYAFEWPDGWIGIDADVVPQRDKF